MDFWDWVVLGVIVLIVIGLAFNLFGRRGGEIAKHPQGRRRGMGQKGAEGSGELSGQDEAEATEPTDAGRRGTKP